MHGQEKLPYIIWIRVGIDWIKTSLKDINFPDQLELLDHYQTGIVEFLVSRVNR